MIFWIEDDIKISYNQLIKDILNEKSSFNLIGYKYFLGILIELLNGYKLKSIDDLIGYIIQNKNSLDLIIHTSGTTSKPKSIKVKLSNCIRHVKVNDNFEVRVWGMGYPVGSFASTQVFFQSIINKETIIYLYSIHFKLLNEIFSNYNISNLTCTPTFLSMMLINFRHTFESVKKITTGGERMRQSLVISLKKVFPNAEYINIYASTETGSLLYSNSEYFSIPKKYKSLIKIQDKTLRVHKSLLNQINEIENDWFNTNDIVEYINDYQFRILSRANGYINTGGYRISPSEIEDKLLSINGVVDVHVYGKPNSLLGTVLCADIICSGIDIKTIKSEALNFIEKQKIPQIIRLVSSFEYVYNGKKKLIV